MFTGNHFPLHTSYSSVYYRSHTPINFGYVTGIYYHSGIEQECLCIKLPIALTMIVHSPPG